MGQLLLPTPNPWTDGATIRPSCSVAIGCPQRWGLVFQLPNNAGNPASACSGENWRRTIREFGTERWRSEIEQKPVTKNTMKSFTSRIFLKESEKERNSTATSCSKSRCLRADNKAKISTKSVPLKNNWGKKHCDRNWNRLDNNYKNCRRKTKH
jgi:hypothetical protein